MQNPLAQPQIDFARYARLLWRRKWFILAPLLIFPVAAGLYAMQLPDSFQSTTLILVQPQKVPANFIASTVTTSIGERLQTISQQIFSRTRLEQIINEFNLFAEARQTRPPEEIVERMRARISLQVHRNDAFRLSFVDPNPRLAMLVTNKLASLFIEENLKVREQQAIGTSLFLDDEIARYRDKISEREAKILEFKRRHLHELPEQLASNQSMLVQLQGQLKLNADNINAAEGRRVQLQQQIAELERRAEAEAAAPAAVLGGTSISELLLAQFQQSAAGGTGIPGAEGPDDGALRGVEAELQKRRAVLENLLLTYTERHPDVARLKAEIGRLEERADELRAEYEEARAAADAERARAEEERAREEAQRAALEPTAPSPEQAAAPSGPRYPPVYEKLRADLLKAEADIARLTAQNDEIHKQIALYQARIAATPARQLELQQISEDYDNIKKVHQNLIDKKLQADLSENLERKQKGEQFQILDPANLPVKPFSPNRLRLVALGGVVGLALGLGLVLLFDLLDLSVKTRQELAAVSGLPVLGAIPEIAAPGDRRRRWMWRLAFSGTAVLCMLVATGIVHWTVKPIPQAVSDFTTQVRATHWTTTR